MNTMYICQNCRELYKPPRRKNGWCKTCCAAACAAENKIKETLTVEQEALRNRHVLEQEALRNRHVLELEAAKERAELKRKNARTIALLKRYKPQ